jgi:hypothetical protein
VAVTREPDAPEDQERSPRRRRRRRESSEGRTWKRISAAAAAIAAVLAVLASLTSLLDWVGDRFGSEPVAPPRTIDARIEGAGLKSRREPLREYLEDTQQSTSGLSRLELREPGLVFTVRVRLRGGVGRDYPLVWTLYDMRRGSAVSDDLYEQEAATFRPEAATHARTWPIWVPYPGQAGRYRLDLVLQDDKRRPVDERSTEPFAIASVPSLE